MSSRIFDLKCLLFDMEVGNNEDWRDSWPYLDKAGFIPLAGIDFDFTLRSLANGAIVVAASTGSSVGGLPLNGRVAVGGASGAVLGLNIPRAAMLRILPADGGYNHETQARVPGFTKTVARGLVTIRQGQAP